MIELLENYRPPPALPTFTFSISILKQKAISSVSPGLAHDAAKITWFR
ncbi:hypothetical protein [Spirosoma gilvum]